MGLNRSRWPSHTEDLSWGLGKMPLCSCAAHGPLSPLMWKRAVRGTSCTPQYDVVDSEQPEVASHRSSFPAAYSSFHLIEQPMLAVC